MGKLVEAEADDGGVKAGADGGDFRGGLDLGHGGDAGEEGGKASEGFAGAFDDDVAGHARVANGAGDVFRGAVLVIDVDGNAAAASPVERLAEGGDAMALAGVEGADLGKREAGDFAFAVGGAVDGFVVHEDEFAVGGLADVGLHVIGAGGGGGLKGGDGVFRGKVEGAAVAGDEDGAGRRLGGEEGKEKNAKSSEAQHSPHSIGHGEWVKMFRPGGPSNGRLERRTMDKFRIVGGHALSGAIAVSGSKNSSLALIAACLLTEEPVVLRRVPNVRDIRTMLKLLEYNGATVEWREDGSVKIEAKTITNPEAPYDVVKTMRASSLVLGPLVARCGSARVSMPGGCSIGARPINLHVNGLEHLGAVVSQEHGYIEARADAGLRGNTVHFERITVTGTEDLLMAAALAKGRTVLENAAREPEVVDVADLLNKMGARVEGAGTSRIVVEGVEKLHGAEHEVIADRIEAGTFVIAGAIRGSELRVEGCVPEHFASLTAKLRQAGVRVEESDTAVEVRPAAKLRSVDVTTEEHPGFATDLQAQFMALMTQATGISFVTENIFENRFMHVPELARMGANIRIEGRQAIVAGPSELTGAQVMCSDLRASASLVLGALVARGESMLDRVYHIDRGYERIEEKLRRVGAEIERVG